MSLFFRYLCAFASSIALVCSPAFAQSSQKKPSPAQAKKQVEQEAAESGKTVSPKKAEPEKPADPMSSATFNGLKFRLIGPSLISGRVVALAVDPHDRSHYFVAAASGGVWKTMNSGTTFTPVFDSEGSYSIGTVVLDPHDSSVVWVGTGENNSQRSVSYGDGVYRSEDGGKSWKNMGLKKSEHIGRILIDPRDSSTVYVAAQGPLWGRGGDRGLYKSTDGGKTWNKVLNISENTGVTDVALDPDNPDTLYAAAYQRRRHVFTLIDGGPESAIYKSTDAGATWTKLKSGLPSDDIGRIGLAVSPADPNLIYATIEAANAKGGIFRSSDRGATWERRNNFDTTAMYYGQIVADPQNVDRIYVMNVWIMVSDDGGKTLRRLGERSKHGDNHVIWIDPDNSNYYLVGCDGGVYESFDRAATWNYKANLPLAQFYDVTVDNSRPFYFVYGGTQDNNSLGGPSRTRNLSGIVNSDWFITAGGDGFRSQVDPEDPNTIYAESQYGGLVRHDRRTGERVGIQPHEAKGGEPYRWNWDSPLLISPHSHTRIYFAANKLFRSDDRGDTWRAISGDLTRQIDRNKLPVMGKVWGPDAVAKNASTSFYGNIVALAESPKQGGLIFAGTDDGLIQITHDGGGAWTKHDKFPGVPETTYVSRLAASHHDANLVYASFDNHKNSDFKPYLLKSTDAGRSWTSIAANLPENGPVLAIAEDPVNPNLLFVGTEFGVFFSINRGGKWVQLKGGMPTISVRDLVIHSRQGDLVAATFGRGIYILDDITPLRTLKPEMLQQPIAFFPAEDALLYVEAHPIGGRGKAGQGESFYTAENPAFGATFTYYLKEKLKSKKEKRQEAEREAAKKGESVPYPSSAELRAEEEEEAPAIYLTISDASGRPFRRISGPVTEGIHRVAWELRYPAPALPPETPSEGDEDFPAVRGQGPLVMPGQYTVVFSAKLDGELREFGAAQKFAVTTEGVSFIKPEDRNALFEFQQKVASLYRAISGALSTAENLKTRLKAVKRAIQETPAAGNQLAPRADAIEVGNNQVLRALRGDIALRARNENTPASINDRVSGIMDDQRFAITRPTRTHLDAYAIASQEFAEQLARLRKLMEVDLAGLEKDMEAAGAPWTPGRIPQWQER